MTNCIPFTYRIIHNPTGKWYYGVKYSKGCNPSDLWVTYFTSSKTIHSLIKETGKESFSVEIRKIFSDAKLARDWEHKVLRKVINWEMCLNLSAFPAVSFETTQKTKQSKLIVDPETGLNSYHRASITWNSRRLLIDPETGKTYGELCRLKSRETKIKNGTLSKPNPKLSGDNNPMKNPKNAKKVSIKLKDGYSSGRLVNAFSGKKHSDKSLQEMRDKKLGENNPCFGTMFINDGASNKRIPKNSIIPDGWIKGRYITKQHKENALANNAITKDFMCDIQNKKLYNRGNACKKFPELKPYF